MDSATLADASPTNGIGRRSWPMATKTKSPSVTTFFPVGLEALDDDLDMHADAGAAHAGVVA
ncbi:MAG: hypothetical protein ACOYNL_02665 [Rickettsiales bacterium]